MHPILIQVGPVGVPTYGVLVALGYLAGILWLKSQLRWMPDLDEDRFWKLIYALFFGAVAGGKLLFLALNWQALRGGELRLLRDFRYGFVFYGGLLGSAAAGLAASRRLRLPYLAVADYFGVALPLGHAIGRLGCLAAGCCYGKPTDMPWGVVLGGHPASSTPEYLWGVPLHPTQVYEALANAAIALGLWALPRLKQGRLAPGAVFIAYLLLYALARFSVELLRGDDRGGTWAGLSVSQWLALVTAGASLILLLRRRGARA